MTGQENASGDRESVSAIIQKALGEVARLQGLGHDVTNIAAKARSAEKAMADGDARSAEMFAREAIILAKVLGRVKSTTQITTAPRKTTTVARMDTGKFENLMRTLDQAVVHMNKRVDALEKLSLGGALGRDEVRAIAEEAARESAGGLLASDVLTKRIREAAPQAKSDAEAPSSEQMEKTICALLDSSDSFREHLAAFNNRLLKDALKRVDEKIARVSSGGEGPAKGGSAKGLDAAGVDARVEEVLAGEVHRRFVESVASEVARKAVDSIPIPSPEEIQSVVSRAVQTHPGVSADEARTIAEETLAAAGLPSEDTVKRMAIEAVQQASVTTPAGLDAEDVRKITEEQIRAATKGLPNAKEMDVRITHAIAEAVGKLDILTTDQAQQMVQEVTAGLVSPDAVDEKIAAALSTLAIPTATDVEKMLAKRPAFGPEEARKIAREVTAQAAEKIVTRELLDKNIKAALAGLRIPSEEDFKRLSGEVVHQALDKRPALGEKEIAAIARKSLEESIRGQITRQDVERMVGEKLSALHVPGEKEIGRIASEQVAAAMAAVPTPPQGLNEDDARRIVGETVAAAAAGMASLDDVDNRIAAALERMPAAAPSMDSTQVQAIVAEATAELATVGAVKAEVAAAMETIRTLTPEDAQAMIEGAMSERPAGIGAAEVQAAVEAAIAQAVEGVVRKDDLDALLGQVDDKIVTALSVVPDFDRIEARMREIVSATTPPAGLDETAVRSMIGEALAAQPAAIDEARISEIAAEAASRAAEARGGTSAAALPDAEALNEIVKERVAELTRAMLESPSFEEFLVGIVHKVSPKSQTTVTSKVHFTEDAISELANSDSFYKMLNTKFRQMQQYLADDVIPPAVDRYLDKLYKQQDASQPPPG